MTGVKGAAAAPGKKAATTKRKPDWPRLVRLVSACWWLAVLLIWGFLKKERRWKTVDMRQHAISLLILLVLSLLLYGV